jgi:hypothetical protein
MTKFKVGDRVRVRYVESTDGADVGQLGTVLELSTQPWVVFDTPTRYESGVSYLEGARAGYMDCLYEDNLELIEQTPEPTMNQQQQIEIIQAHMNGKQVLELRTHNSANDWRPLAKGEYCFNFRDYQYKIEPRKLELFMQVPSGVMQAFSYEGKAHHNVVVSNYAPHELVPGHILVQLTCLEP